MSPLLKCMDRSSGQLTQSLNLDDWIIEVVKVSETHLEGVRVNDIQKFKYGRIIFTNLLPLVMRFGFTHHHPSLSLLASRSPPFGQGGIMDAILTRDCTCPLRIEDRPLPTAKKMGLAGLIQQPLCH